MKIPKTLFLFDIDGTLMMGGDASRKAFEMTFWKVFGAGVNLEAVNCVGRTDREILLRLSKPVGLTEPFVRSQMPVFFAEYSREIEIQMSVSKGKRILPGVKALLETLSAGEGALLALLTGNIERGARAKLDAFDLGGYFRFGAFGDDAEDRADLVDFAIDRGRSLGLINNEFDKGDVMIVGDSVRDIACARANGTRVAAVATGLTAYEELRLAEPDYLFEDFRDTGSVAAVLAGTGTERTK